MTFFILAVSVLALLAESTRAGSRLTSHESPREVRNLIPIRPVYLALSCTWWSIITTVSTEHSAVPRCADWDLDEDVSAWMESRRGNWDPNHRLNALQTPSPDLQRCTVCRKI
ncbi:hypothetical protein BJ875DRAFT_62186 [Amylocarpus encephaloides]|uniref:Secreted protein n=1 Tax=Amylocarpus encephaloides TaxID=45428 RepID=A0A9P8C3W8_9HELO|nr:hypothetical protein BJ875DRAFT_62186 [Amylocarpus encephaloides]